MAELELPAETSAGAAAGAAATRKPLWNGTQVSVFGVTGEFESGKTLAVLTIDPENTLYYDYEKSGGTYRNLVYEGRVVQVKKRIDVPSEMLKKFPNGYKPIDVFLWWRDHARSIKPGEFSVIAVDPISDVEKGLVDWIKANPKEFGKTETQYEKASALLWEDVKAHWKMLLADLSSRCDTFSFTTHMRDVWKGTTNTGKREAKGKETLAELASLYILLERNFNQKGEKPDKPTGIVKKSRLISIVTKNGVTDQVPSLPPRLEQATYPAICRYIQDPPDYGKLKKGEKVEPHVPTEEEIAARKERISENERVAAESKLATMHLSVEAGKKARAVTETQAVPETKEPVKTVPATTALETKEPVAKEPATPPVTAQETPAKGFESSEETTFNFVACINRIMNLKESLQIPDEKWADILKRRSIGVLAEAHQASLHSLYTALHEKQLKLDLQAEAENKAAGVPF